MALSDEIKCKVMYHLSRPVLTIVEGSTNYNSVVNDRLDTLPSFAEEKVEDILADLEEAEQALKDAKKCLKLQQVDDITFNVNHLENLRFEYNRLVKKLSCTVDISTKGTTINVGITA